MRVREIDILVVPGWGRNSKDHWQSRWASKLSTARTVEPDNWQRPERTAWVERIVAEVALCRRPTVLVAHSFGVAAVVHAARRLADTQVAGALLVAPPDLDERETIEGLIAETGQGTAFSESFLPMPMEPLPFPAKLIGSSTDPYCSVARTQAYGHAWGADVSIVADAGHIDTASGHGPWPEGLLTFGMFLKRLGSVN